MLSPRAPGQVDIFRSLHLGRQHWKLRAVSAAILLLFVLTGSASGSTTTYTYAGKPFTNFSGPGYPPCPPAPGCSITGSLTLAAPLAPNFIGYVTPLSFTFTDGFVTGTQLNSTMNGTVPYFLFYTDCSGNIINWGIGIVIPQPSFPSSGYSLFTSNILPFEVSDSSNGAFSGSSIAAYVVNNPGTWSVTTSGGSSSSRSNANACCPPGSQDLQVTPFPPSVFPQLPDNGPPLLPTQASVKATAKGCPSQAGNSVTVNFQIQRGPGDSGGHEDGHATPPKHGNFYDTGVDTDTCNALLDANGAGSCLVPYVSSDVSGDETISATAASFPDARTTVRIQVPFLVNDLANGPQLRLTGQTFLHPDNHWATEFTQLVTQILASEFLRKYQATLGINDMSLRLGGLFDICGKWDPNFGCSYQRLDGTIGHVDTGHYLHRRGWSVDIDRSVSTSGNAGTVPINLSQRDFVLDICRRFGGHFEPEGSIHCEIPQ
jgi:hypothetical protein